MTNYFLVLKPNKQVNLNAHHTHRDAKVEKGIDLNAPPLRPVELSKLKDQRDQQLEQTRATLAFNARPVYSCKLFILTFCYRLPPKFDHLS